MKKRPERGDVPIPQHFHRGQSPQFPTINRHRPAAAWDKPRSTKRTAGMAHPAALSIADNLRNSQPSTTIDMLRLGDKPRSTNGPQGCLIPQHFHRGQSPEFMTINRHRHAAAWGQAALHNGARGCLIPQHFHRGQSPEFPTINRHRHAAAWGQAALLRSVVSDSLCPTRADRVVEVISFAALPERRRKI